MAVQNPAGRNHPTPIEDILAGIRDALSGFSTSLNSVLNTITGGASPVGGATTINVGNKARFIALSNGIRLEVQNSSGVWITEAEWTEA